MNSNFILNGINFVSFSGFMCSVEDSFFVLDFRFSLHIRIRAQSP